MTLLTKARTDLVRRFCTLTVSTENVRVKLNLLNPSKSQRDELYMKRVNPVCTFLLLRTVLFGDKTH